MELDSKFSAFSKGCLSVKMFLKTKLSQISADTLAWVTNVVLHCSTLPSFLALMTGIASRTPPVDLILMVWSALALLFFRAVFLKDLLNIITIGVGFMIQAMFLVLIFFK